MKLPPTRAWRLDEKVSPRLRLFTRPTALIERLLTARSRARQRANFESCSAPPLARPLPGLSQRCASARAANTKKPHSLKSCRARNANAARAPHTSPAVLPRRKHQQKSAAGARPLKLHRERFNRRLTRQTPQAFHSKEAVAHVHHVDDSTVATTPTPRAGVPRYSLRSSAKTRTTVIRAAGSV